MTLVLGSRRSPMAVAQLDWVAARLRAAGLETQTWLRDTQGDRDQTRPLPEIGGKGLFTQDLEQDLLAGRIDLAVHSLKDLPVQLPHPMRLLAVTQRDDPSDCLIGGTLCALAAGSRVGTSSLRRAALLQRARPDLKVLPVRGNLNTRLRKLDSGEYDALCVASAGVDRVGLSNRIAERLPTATFVPAPGQGMLGVESAAARGDLLPLRSILQDEIAYACARAERSCLAALGEGCQLPFAAYAQRIGEHLSLHAVVLSRDGAEMIECSDEADAERAGLLGERVGRELKRCGAQELLRGGEA